jgi:hypothetical protein
MYRSAFFCEKVINSTLVLTKNTLGSLRLKTSLAGQLIYTTTIAVFQAGRPSRVPSTNSVDELKKDQKRKVSYLKNIDPKIASRILDEVVQKLVFVVTKDL